MNADVKKKWLDRLRSGRDKQAFGRLKDSRGGFCCLGVLCEIAVEEGVIEPPIESSTGWWYGNRDRSSVAYREDLHAASLVGLPSPVMAWAGLMATTPRIPGMTYLSNINDGGKHDFKAIADLIEEHL